MTGQRAGGRPIIPPSMAEFAEEYGFAPGFEAGGLLFISGQIGADASGEAPEVPAEQARLAFEVSAPSSPRQGWDSTTS